MAPLQLRVLGGFAAVLPTRGPVEIAGKKNRALLAYLALHADRKVTRDKLVGLLWSDRSEAQARSSLRQALAALRRDLAGIEPAPLTVAGDVVALDGSAVRTDAAVFTNLATSDSAGELRQAVELYEGALLDGIDVRDPAFEDWLTLERTRLGELAIGALTRLMAHSSGADAIAMGHRLVALDPLREASHHALMHAYAAQGQLEQAIRQHHQCRDILRRELDVTPSAKLEELYRAIKAGTYAGPPTAPPAPADTPFPKDAALGSDKPSIAVLPFVNRSGDPEQAYFSDGITEDIITELSRFRFLFVVARDASFAKRGADREGTADAREIGRALGVRYVVEGSVRRAGDRIRVTAQLIDAGTGSHLWAERYDRDLGDIFSVQEEIARQIAASLAPRIEAEGIDLAKRKRPEKMRAYDYFLRAKLLLDTAHDGADLSQAREYCDRGIEIDPSYARAHAQKAFTYIVGLELMEAESVAVWRRQGLESAERAVLLDPMDEFCHWALGEAAAQAGQYNRALDHMARALAINPNDSNVLASAGRIQALAGDAEAGLRQTSAALERNPFGPSWYHWMQGDILYMLGRFDEALRAFNLCGPANVGVLRGRAAALVALGRLDEAREDMRALLAIRPAATVSEAKRFLDHMPKLEQYLDGLRRAGLPA